MNAKQTKLIEQAATVETDGEGWRKRMDEWIEASPRLTLDKLIEARKLFDKLYDNNEACTTMRNTGKRMWYRGFEYIA